MRRALALLTLFASAVVFAEWYPLSVPGTPNDANIISTANGRIVISTSDGVFEVRDGGIVQEMIRGANVAWGTVDGGCLIAYSGSVRHVCSDAGTQLFTGGNSPTQILRVNPVGGIRYLSGKANVGNGVWLEEVDSGISRVQTISGPPSFSPANSFPRMGTWAQSGGKHVVVSGFPNSLLLHGVDGGFTEEFPGPTGGVGLGFAGTTNAELEVFEEGLGFRLLIVNYDGGSGVIASVPLPLDAGAADRFSTPAGIDRVMSVAFDSTTNPTNTFADGFGMATGRTSAGGGQILQPVPELLNPARVWVANQNQASLTGPFTRVSCLDGRVCVVLTDRDAGANVYVYENRNAPQFATAGSGVVAAGGVVTFDLSASDPDGDPIVYDAGGLIAGDAGSITVLDAGVIQFTAGAVCGAQRNVTFSAAASDGVYNSAQLFLLTISPGNPDPPTISSTVLQLQAGGDAGRIDVTPAAGGVCAATAIVWTELDGGSLFASIADAGNGRVFTPPAHYCSATPGEATFDVVATNGAGVSSSQTVTAQLLPWGPPDRPFASDLTINLDAGEQITLARDGGHFCGIVEPTLTTLWDLPQVDGGIRVNNVPLTIALPDFPAPSLTITTAECVNASFDIPVQNQVLNQVSQAPDPVVHVNVTANLSVSAVNFSSLTADEFDGGLLVSAATDFACAGAIGLSANVDVSRGGQPVGDGGLNFTPSAGSVFFPLPDCAGGTFDVTARLINSDGGASSVVKTTSKVVPAGTVPPPTLIVEDTQVSCATGGSATVSVVTKPRCTGLSYVWKPAGGLGVELSDGGDSISLRTTSTELGELLGQSVQLQVTPVSGSKTFPSTLQEVTFGMQPFVTVEHETDAPVASDTELFGITVTLTNTQPCEVSNVDYVETLTDTRVVPASVRVNGAPVDSERIVIGSKTMAVKGLTLPPGQPVRLYYSARPVLFGAPKPAGKAVLRFGEATEYEISEPAGFAREPGTNPPGCGCNAGSGGAFALIALLTLVRRRRQISHSRS